MFVKFEKLAIGDEFQFMMVIWRKRSSTTGVQLQNNQWMRFKKDDLVSIDKPIERKKRFITRTAK